MCLLGIRQLVSQKFYEVLIGIRGIQYYTTPQSTVRTLKISAYSGVCENTILYLRDTVPGFKIETICLNYPVSDDEIITRTKSALELNKKIKLVFMDAISSLPAVRFPWEKVCQLCHQYKVYSLVDGAHAITQIPIDISQTKPDFFISNLHKWSYVPRGCALLYVRRPLQSLVHSIPIGETYVSSTNE